MNLKIFEFDSEIVDVYTKMLSSLYSSTKKLPFSIDAYNNAVNLVTHLPVPYKLKKKNMMCMLISAYSAVTGYIVKVHPIVSALIGSIQCKNASSGIPVEYYLQDLENHIPASAEDKSGKGVTLISAIESQLRINMEFPTAVNPVVVSSCDGYFLAYVENERFAVLSKAVYSMLGRVTRLTADDDGIHAEGGILVRVACDKVLSHNGLLKDDFVLV